MDLQLSKLLDSLEQIAHDSVDYVGSANYQERQTEMHMKISSKFDAARRRTEGALLFEETSSHGSTCSNCKFWCRAERLTGSKPPRGECRAHAPEGIGYPYHLWSVTLHNDWCGEFRMKAPYTDERPMPIEHPVALHT